jgi:hypothetical protein
VFENQKKNQFATRVPVEGEISQIETSVWPALWGVFSNAFVEAFERNTDGTISIASASLNNAKEPEAEKEEKKSKKELRRERRKEKREQRKHKKEKEGNEKADKKSPKDNSFPLKP